MKKLIEKGRITIDPKVRFGKPCIRGTRTTVGDILNLLISGYTVSEIPKQYPGITKQDAMSAIHFAITLSEEPSKIAFQI